ncbi:MAG: AAA family ATPase [Chloroflexota bacterium]
MKLTVRLFVQKHQNRTYTITTPQFPGISAYGPTLEECKEEITEALVKRLSEMEPEALQHVAFKPNQTLEKVAVELRPTGRNSKRRREPISLTISLIVTAEEEGQLLVSAPRLRYPPLAFYVRSHDELQEIAQIELAEYFYGESFENLLEYRTTRHESLDSLEVNFKPKKAIEREDEEEEELFWALKANGTNLTAKAAEGQLRRAFRRDNEVDTVLSAITSDRRSSVLLIGPSGVGKTAIVHEVARRIRRKECAEALHDRQLWSTSAASLIAGCSFIGQWQEKLTDIVREVRKKRLILFVDDITDLAEAGRHTKSDDNIADFLKPHIQSGDIIIIGESSPERLRRTEQLTPGFVAQLRTLEIAPTGEADTLSVLTAVSRELERAEEVRIDPSALESAAELTSRFLPYRVQPGKSITLLEQMVNDANRENETYSSTTKRKTLTRKQVIDTFTRQTGLPEFIVADDIPLDLADVQSHFTDRVIGQEGAMEAMVDLIAIVKAGLHDPTKPLGTFLFIGPTGVGKTQLAKTLAEYLFGDAQRMLRFDMSEYADPAAVRRLIGMPGSQNDGELTRRVRAQPFCVLLLDEFEKADMQIYDVFLQVLGEGRLTDATGQTTSFQNAIILLTSNLGASAREQRNIGLTGEQNADGVSGQNDNGEQTFAVGGQRSNYWQRQIEQYFRPEFVNRLDQIVSFKQLDEGAMRKIAQREIGDVLLREGLVRRNVMVDIHDNVIELLLEQGFNSTYGARPLKRAIERVVVLPLARFLAGRKQASVDLIRLQRDQDRVVLSASNLSTDERTSEVTLSTSASALSGKMKQRRMDDQNLARAYADLRRTLTDWNERDTVTEMHNERATRLADTNKPTFWDDGDAARATLARFYFLDRLLKRLQQLIDRSEYLEELAGLVYRQRDPRYRSELVDSYERLNQDVAFLEVELLCAHIAENHSAIVRLQRVGQFNRNDESIPWLLQLASIYLRWAQRKGYDIECYVLEALSSEERQGDSLIERYYPYRWKSVTEERIEEALKTQQTTPLHQATELAIGLKGTNVYGFLKSEIGVHRRNDKRASGERTQQLTNVLLDPPKDLDPQAWLEQYLLKVAWHEREMAELSKKERAALPGPLEPDIIRVYQFDGERMVRDLRTQIKTTDIGPIIDGALDEFILAYLRDEESKEAWAEEEENA